MSVQTYHAYINQKTEKVVLHTDHLAALAEKESHLMLRNAIITHLEMVITERNERIATLTAERERQAEEIERLWDKVKLYGLDLPDENESLCRGGKERFHWEDSML